MRLASYKGKVPTQYEITTGGLAYDFATNSMYTKLRNGEIHQIDLGNTDPVLSNRNKIINGDFSVWQRGDSFTINAGDWGYTSDRWIFASVGATSGSTWIYKTDLVGEYTGLSGMTVDPQSLVLAGSIMSVLQRIEDVSMFAGKEVTMTIVLDNQSAAYDHEFLFHQFFGVGGSPDVNTSVTVRVPSGISTQKITMQIPSIQGKTIGTSSYLQVYALRTFSTPKVTIITAQIEAGRGTVFERKLAGKELFDCQRYYFKAVGQGIEGLNPDGHTGLTYSQVIKWPNMMRVNPTTAFNFDDAVNNTNGGHSCSVVSDAAVGESSKYVWNLQIILSGATTGCWFGMGTTDFISADSEL